MLFAILYALLFICFVLFYCRWWYSTQICESNHRFQKDQLLNWSKSLRISDRTNAIKWLSNELIRHTENSVSQEGTRMIVSHLHVEHSFTSGISSATYDGYETKKNVYIYVANSRRWRKAEIENHLMIFCWHQINIRVLLLNHQQNLMAYLALQLAMAYACFLFLAFFVFLVEIKKELEMCWLNYDEYLKLIWIHRTIAWRLINCHDT